MSSKTLCSSCLRNLHHQIRTKYYRPYAPIASLQHSSAGRNVGVQKSFSIFASRRASTATGNDAASRKFDLSKDTPAGSKSDNGPQGQGGNALEQYDAIGATQALFKECASQADYTIPQAFDRKLEIPKNTTGEDIGEGYGWWYESLGLTPTFNTWAQVTMLHLYLLTVRFRYFTPDQSKSWQQHLHDHFFYECEHRMTIFHGMSARSIRNRNLKELYNQWRGMIGAYDEGLIKGDAVLGTAVWRNIFKADEQVDWRDVAMVTSFMRRGLKALDKAQDKTIASASVRFGSPAGEKAVVSKSSPLMARPLGKEDETALKELLEGKKGQ
ncbi:MAG: hypothetical protein Q9162_004483 [Coniocarpon cinnabarinum]